MDTVPSEPTTAAGRDPDEAWVPPTPADLDALLIQWWPLQRDEYVAYIAARADALDVEALLHPERLRRAAIYVLQLADKDIGPLLGERLRDAILSDDREYRAILAEQKP
jgi:hypothetical protein